MEHKSAFVVPMEGLTLQEYAMKVVLAQEARWALDHIISLWESVSPEVLPFFLNTDNGAGSSPVCR